MVAGEQDEETGTVYSTLDPSPSETYVKVRTSI